MAAATYMYKIHKSALMNEPTLMNENRDEGDDDDEDPQWEQTALVRSSTTG